MPESIADFIAAIEGADPLPEVFNPWRDHCIYDARTEGPAIRRAHLRHYLEQRQDRARLILCAEAVGYQGGHYSGIAMTSERILLGHLAPTDGQNGVYPNDVFAGPKQRTSAVDCPCAGELGANEPTATIVWGALRKLGLDPYSVVLWNAMPFHPYRENDGPLTNRAPRTVELEATLPLRKQFLALFPRAQVAAIGKVSEKLLAGRAITALRHPAYGGANTFREQLAALAAAIAK